MEPKRNQNGTNLEPEFNINKDNTPPLPPSPAKPAVENVENSPKLLPCPFCGSAASVVCLDGLPHDQYYIACENDECPVCSETFGYDTEAEAAEAWNIRAERTCRNVSDIGFGFKCSACGDWEDIEHNPYCPGCGAKVVE